MFKETIRKWVSILISFFNSTENVQTPSKAADPRHCAEDLRPNWEYKYNRQGRMVPVEKMGFCRVTIQRQDEMHYCIVCDSPMVDFNKKVILIEDIDQVIYPLPVQSEFGPEGHLVWAHWGCMNYYMESLKSPWSFEMNVKLQVRLVDGNKFRFEDQAFNCAKHEVQRRLQEYGIRGINVSITEVNKISAEPLSK